MTDAQTSSRIATEVTADLTIYVVHPGDTPETFDAVVAEPIVELLDTLKEARAADPGLRCVLVHIDDGTVDEALSEALFEAIRAVCGSLTLESAGTSGRINLIRTSSMHDAADTIQFLSSGAAGFVAGSTIDVRACAA